MEEGPFLLEDLVPSQKCYLCHATETDSSMNHPHLDLYITKFNLA